MAAVVATTLLHVEFAHALGEPVAVPARLLHVDRQRFELEPGHWIAAARSREELERAWARLATVGDAGPPAIDFGQQFVVVTSRLAPCVEPPREQTAMWDASVLTVRVSAEPTTGGCPAMVERVEWVAAFDRDALPGAVTDLVLIGQRGDELARIQVSIDGSPPSEPEPTLPETGLPVVALVLMALAFLGAGGTLTRWPARRRRGRP